MAGTEAEAKPAHARPAAISRDVDDVAFARALVEQVANCAAAASLLGGFGGLNVAELVILRGGALHRLEDLRV